MTSSTTRDRASAAIAARNAAAISRGSGGCGGASSSSSATRSALAIRRRQILEHPWQIRLQQVSQPGEREPHITAGRRCLRNREPAVSGKLRARAKQR